MGIILKENKYDENVFDKYSQMEQSKKGLEGSRRMGKP